MNKKFRENCIIFVPTDIVPVMNKAFFEAVHEIVKTGHWFTDSLSKEFKEFDIYEPQFNVLRILRGAKGKPLCVNAILESMLHYSSNVTRIVDKLTNKGLVERKLSCIDRRKMDIIITAKGLKLLEALDKKVDHFYMPMFDNLNSDEAKTLKQLIVKLKGTSNV